MTNDQTTAPEPETLLTIELAGLPLDDLGEWLETMLVIREFEDSLEPLTRSGQIPGDVHQATGQEAVAVGVIRALASTDIVASPHRPHHHALAKGLTPRAVMAELWGRTTGCSGWSGWNDAPERLLAGLLRIERDRRQCTRNRHGRRARREAPSTTTRFASASSVMAEPTRAEHGSSSTLPHCRSSR